MRKIVHANISSRFFQSGVRLSVWHTPAGAEQPGGGDHGVGVGRHSALPGRGEGRPRTAERRLLSTAEGGAVIIIYRSIY